MLVKTCFLSFHCHRLPTSPMWINLVLLPGLTSKNKATDRLLRWYHAIPSSCLKVTSVSEDCLLSTHLIFSDHHSSCFSPQHTLSCWPHWVLGTFLTSVSAYDFPSVWNALLILLANTYSSFNTQHKCPLLSEITIHSSEQSISHPPLWSHSTFRNSFPNHICCIILIYCVLFSLVFEFWEAKNRVVIPST